MKTFVVISAVLATILGLGASRAPAGNVRMVKATTYVVQRGDTLWSIAATMPGDRREAVFGLMQVNHLSAAGLQPGQRLVLPAH